MKTQIFSALVAAAACLMPQSAQAEIKGKVDFGPAYAHIDEFRNKDAGNERVNKVDLYGIQTGASVVVWQGLVLKPALLMAWGDGAVYEGSLGLGWIIPVNDKLLVTPIVGGTLSYLETDSFVPDIAPGVLFAREAYSRSPYVGLEVSWSPCDKWTITGFARYAWSHTRFEIGTDQAAPFPIVTKTESTGVNGGGQVDYWIDDHWAINIAGAYSNSRSKDKLNALRGYGGRVGVGYFF